jgi:hypothetical protein
MTIIEARSSSIAVDGIRICPENAPAAVRAILVGVVKTHATPFHRSYANVESAGSDATDAMRRKLKSVTNCDVDSSQLGQFRRGIVS